MHTLWHLKCISSIQALLLCSSWMVMILLGIFQILIITEMKLVYLFCVQIPYW